MKRWNWHTFLIELSIYIVYEKHKTVKNEWENINSKAGYYILKNAINRKIIIIINSFYN